MILRRSYSGASSLGQFLESRTTFLDSLEHQIRQTNEVARRRKALEHASSLASLENQEPSSARECPALEVSDFTSDQSGDHVSSLRTMLDAGMHLGHSTSKWNARMAPFIHGIRHSLHIIDLDKTLACLRQACQVAREVARNPSACILFVGTRAPIRRLTYECAVAAKQYYVCDRWTPGTLTNARTVLGSQAALYHQLGADPHSHSLRPALLVLLQWLPVAIREAERCRVPTIALCDTDSDPSMVTFPVPGNDDAFAAVELVGRVLARAASEGREAAEKGLADADARIVDSAERFSREALGQVHPSLFH